MTGAARPGINGEPRTEPGGFGGGTHAFISVSERVRERDGRALHVIGDGGLGTFDLRPTSLLGYPGQRGVRQRVGAERNAPVLHILNVVPAERPGLHHVCPGAETIHPRVPLGAIVKHPQPRVQISIDTVG